MRRSLLLAVGLVACADSEAFIELPDDGGAVLPGVPGPLTPDAGAPRDAGSSTPAPGDAGMMPGNGAGTGTGSNGSGGALGTRNDWPCTGCVTKIPSGYRADRPTAVLVALHGDEGTSGPTVGMWSAAAERANVILFAPQCPTAKGCRLCDSTGYCTNSWWGWLQYTSTHDLGWIGAQVDQIEAAYNVDRSREYLTGWSGGADYLGYYALKQGRRFAGAGLVAGGVPYVQTCPACKLAGYFVLGSGDFRTQSGQPGRVRQVLSGCGSATRAETFSGYDHQATISALGTDGQADAMLAFFAANPLACP